MWAQYQKYKPIRQKLDKVALGKREQFEQRHGADLALFNAAARYLEGLKSSGEAITPKAWKAEAQKLTQNLDNRTSFVGNLCAWHRQPAHFD